MLRLVLEVGEFRLGAGEMFLSDLDFPEARFALLDVLPEAGEFLFGCSVLCIDVLEALPALVELGSSVGELGGELVELPLCLCGALLQLFEFEVRLVELGGGILEIGKQRLAVALTLYAKATPRYASARTEGTLDALAEELLCVLPALRASAAAKASNAAKRRVLEEARATGYIVEGRVVAGTVLKVARKPANVVVELKSPAGDYAAVLRSRDVTGVDDAPSFAFLNATFPPGSKIYAEVRAVEVTRADSRVELSTRALERSVGEMSTDPAAVFGRAEARLRAQPKPESIKARRKKEAAALAARDGYLDHLENDGERAFEKARSVIDALHSLDVET